ncbi:MAG: DNA cytosine methyltransferase, partial [Bradyrhizobium sp.]|nr:DNA cytosine methyltransferase [Bradyrhizobium sp.]
FAAQWLRNLIARGLIAPGDVDERSIVDVHPEDLRGYGQCHFFAGIGGWSLALRLAGVPDDEPVWTGSCPCQPLSVAGKRKGHEDERHLWPAFFRLIAEWRPAMVFGEQVASRDGREWLAGIRADLEDVGYACGGADLCAAGVGAPHIRQRLYWVADCTSQRCGEARRHSERHPQRIGESAPSAWLGDGESARLQEQRRQQSESGAGHLRQLGFAVQAGAPEWNGATVAVECSDGWRRIAAEPALFPLAARLPGDVGRLRGSGNAIVAPLAAEFIKAAMP